MPRVQRAAGCPGRARGVGQPGARRCSAAALVRQPSRLLWLLRPPPAAAHQPLSRIYRSAAHGCPPAACPSTHTHTQVWWTERDVVIAGMATAFMLPLCFPRTLNAISGARCVHGGGPAGPACSSLCLWRLGGGGGRTSGGRKEALVSSVQQRCAPCRLRLAKLLRAAPQRVRRLRPSSLPSPCRFQQHHLLRAVLRGGQRHLPRRAGTKGGGQSVRAAALVRSVYAAIGGGAVATGRPPARTSVCPLPPCRQYSRQSQHTSGAHCTRFARCPTPWTPSPSWLLAFRSAPGLLSPLNYLRAGGHRITAAHPAHPHAPVPPPPSPPHKAQCHTNLVAVFAELEPEADLFGSTASLSSLPDGSAAASEAADGPAGGAASAAGAGSSGEGSSQALAQQGRQEPQPPQRVLLLRRPQRRFVSPAQRTQKLQGMVQVLMAASECTAAACASPPVVCMRVRLAGPPCCTTTPCLLLLLPPCCHAVCLTACFYTLVGLAGYLTFPRTALSNILLNYSSKDVPAAVQRGCLANLRRKAAGALAHAPSHAPITPVLTPLRSAPSCGPPSRRRRQAHGDCARAGGGNPGEAGQHAWDVGALCGAFSLLGGRAANHAWDMACRPARRCFGR